MDNLLNDYKDRLDEIGDRIYVLKTMLSVVLEDLKTKGIHSQNREASVIALFIYNTINEKIEQIIELSEYEEAVD